VERRGKGKKKKEASFPRRKSIHFAKVTGKGGPPAVEEKKIFIRPEGGGILTQ